MKRTRYFPEMRAFLLWLTVLFRLNESETLHRNNSSNQVKANYSSYYNINIIYYSKEEERRVFKFVNFQGLKKSQDFMLYQFTFSESLIIAE